ncbi:hypothetical protein TorRG33x02_159900 [Trema orientale]|uniref:Uncharacterized protein n=1 Tax=Trema orientale TaxID=63057 RepID=A0A2P5ERK1_TREOI|nr:hypothetical protein TorRG33x02_159900 [Trema orientale]
MEELVRRKYREAEVFLVMPEKVMGLEWREDSDVMKHHPGSEPLKRCIIEELAKDADIQGMKVVTSQAQIQHSYIDLGPEVEIEYEAPVNDSAENKAPMNEPVENEAPLNEPAKNEDNQNQRTENVTREEEFKFVHEEYA